MTKWVYELAIGISVTKVSLVRDLTSRVGPIRARTENVRCENFEEFRAGACWARVIPLQASHGSSVNSYDLSEHEISVQSCQATRDRSLMWPREEHKGKFLRDLHWALRAKDCTAA